MIIEKANEIEKTSDWNKINKFYNENWNENQSYDFAIRYLFFNMYLNVYWERILYKDKFALDFISQDNLLNNLKSKGKIIISKYTGIYYENDALLVQIMRVIPYPFLSNKYFELELENIINNAYMRLPKNPIVKTVYLGNKFSTTDFSQDDINYLKHKFQSNSLFDNYYKNYFGVN